MDAFIIELLWTAGVVGILLAVVTGVWLVVAPGTALRIATRLNRNYSVAWLQRLLDAPRTTEPFIYRHHRVVGALLVVATAYFFWQLFTAYDQAGLVALYAGVLPEIVLDLLAAAFTATLVVGNAVGLVLGFVIFVRPSLLKGPERWANRWVTSDSAVDALDRDLGGPELIAYRHPRRLGVAILVAAGYVVLILAAAFA